MREWLTVIIVLLIVGIVLDGIRRVRAARRERIHMAKYLPEAEDLPEEEGVGSEFPRGGARVAGYRHPDDIASVQENLKTTLAAKKKTVGGHARIESAPVLMEATGEHLEPSLGNLSDLESDDVAVMVAPAMATKPVIAPKAEVPVTTKHLKTKGQKIEEPTRAAAKIIQPDEVIVINVMAHPGLYFTGFDLLDVLTEQNLRFGNMEIFHRHKNDDGTGEILFSLANIVKPGTFDLNAMDEFETPGMSMFMTLPLKGDSVAAFGLMARTAKAISIALDGELKDEQRSVMTQQTFEHCRQRVIEFERKRRLNR